MDKAELAKRFIVHQRNIKRREETELALIKLGNELEESYSGFSGKAKALVGGLSLHEHKPVAMAYLKAMSSERDSANALLEMTVKEWLK